MSRAKRLAERLLQEREEQRARPPRPPRPLRFGGDFDPFDFMAGKRHTVVAGGDPGYLATAPMREGRNGFHIACRACGKEFESIGMAYCPKCMELPAEERRAMKPAFVGRLCQAPGCEKFIPRETRADVIYCSPACRQRAYRRGRVTDNRAKGPTPTTPPNVTDNEKKDQ